MLGRSLHRRRLFVSGLAICEGDLDFKRFMAILRKANYRGDLCVENGNESGRSQQGLKKCIEMSRCWLEKARMLRTCLN